MRRNMCALCRILHDPIVPTLISRGSDDSIYDTSISEVVDIPRRNSPYYVAYTRTWIFEPSVYFEWLLDQVTSLCHCLLLQQAFSKSRHFSWDINPANTMAYCKN